MRHKRTFREWATDAAKAARQYSEAVIALGMFAFASFIGSAAARWVFGP